MCFSFFYMAAYWHGLPALIFPVHFFQETVIPTMRQWYPPYHILYLISSSLHLPWAAHRPLFELKIKARRWCVCLCNFPSQITPNKLVPAVIYLWLSLDLTVFLFNGIPFVGFGILDNLIMIVAVSKAFSMTESSLKTDAVFYEPIMNMALAYHYLLRNSFLMPLSYLVKEKRKKRLAACIAIRQFRFIGV